MRAWKSLINLDSKIPGSGWSLSDFGGSWFDVTFAYVLLWEDEGLDSAELAFAVVFGLNWLLIEVGWLLLELGLVRLCYIYCVY